jgi:phosphatidylglycerol:prolipoprotein diacylglycerol transferase
MCTGVKTMIGFTFAIALGIGATLGLVWIVQRTGLPRASTAVNAGLVGMLGAYLGGRAAFVIMNLGYFQNQPAEMFRLPVGGFAWPGALAGGLLGILLFSVLSRQPLGILADDCLPLLVTLSVSTWLGCWVIGCAYGAASEQWWALIARDEWGVLGRRWPVQAVGASLSLAVIWVVDQLPEERIPSGAAFTLGVLGLSMVNFFMSLLRADPSPMWNNLRIETWIALLYGALALILLLILFLRSHRKQELHPETES